MPRFDQTGPQGQGSMTGRKMGKCTNYGAKFQNQNATDNQINQDDNQNNGTMQAYGRQRCRKNNQRRGGCGQQRRFGW